MADERLTFGLSSSIISDLQSVFTHFPEIKQVLIFGSRAKNTWKDGSDIDLAVIAPQLSDHEFTEIWNKIDDLPIIFKIDCLHWDRLSNESLKEKILKEGKVLFNQTQQ